MGSAKDFKKVASTKENPQNVLCGFSFHQGFTARTLVLIQNYIFTKRAFEIDSSF
jgi:hypothetical protein